jgi:hypothetical protein
VTRKEERGRYQQLDRSSRQEHFGLNFKMNIFIVLGQNIQQTSGGDLIIPHLHAQEERNAHT